MSKDDIKVVPLGAGREVGRSCVLVFIADKVIMCDCGMHMGFKNYRAFPDFAFLAEGDLTGKVDAVLLSHFHLDHSGALPFFTETVGYSGPILMSAPTRSIAPLLLEDMRKVAKRHGSGDIWNESAVENCMKKATVIGLNQTLGIPGTDITVTAYYAGHVLGAVMFHVQYKGLSFLYTGDYNTANDRHLMGAALLPGLRPTVLISESTYGSTVRDSKRRRERDFLSTVYETVSRGGKVLIPVFAMGRAQELLILIQTFWKRMKLDVPIYFSAGMVARANDYYKLYTHWTNESVRSTFDTTFDFPSMGVFNRSLLQSSDPLVLFSTPGMLHAGGSLEAFKAWCGDARNTVILPGYCVEGTLGHTILSSDSPTIKIEGEMHSVKCKVTYMSFSAHADARGIVRLIQSAAPQAVVLVHGDYEKAMRPLKRKLEQEMPEIHVFCPSNGHSAGIRVSHDLPVALQPGLVPKVPQGVRAALADLRGFAEECLRNLGTTHQQPSKRRRIAGESGEDDEAGPITALAPAAPAPARSAGKWWEKWGVEFHSGAAGAECQEGPADADCGCDLAWVEAKLQDILSLRPAGKYAPLSEGVDDWGVAETVRIVVVASKPSGGECAPTVHEVEAGDAARFMEERGLQEHTVRFTALVPLAPEGGVGGGGAPHALDSCDPETRLPALLSTLRGCVTGHAFAMQGQEEGVQGQGQTPCILLEGTDIRVSVKQGEGGACAGGGAIAVEWSYPYSALAMRVHNAVYDTVGVAV